MVQQFETLWGGKKLIVETGKLAPQTNGACVARYGDTVVLSTVVMSENIREGIDYFPLLVDFEEKLYAAGKIKGSRFLKREGRASDEAVLSGRLVDRSIRPLFNEKIRNDVQVINSVLSFDGENDPDVVSLIAASCALAISDIPWEGPIAGIRISRLSLGTAEDNWIINPSYEEREKSDLDLVIAGNDKKIIMIEAAAKMVPEKDFLKAVAFGQKHFKEALDLISEVQAKVGKDKIQVAQDLDHSAATTAKEEDLLIEKAQNFVEAAAQELLFIRPLMTKAERLAAFATLKTKLGEFLDKEKIVPERRGLIYDFFKKYVEMAVSRAILEKDQRVDGRTLNQVRPVSCEAAVLPRTHGSAIFIRGETQVLSAVTLGSPGDVQFLETIEGSSKKRFMHHYNFPPYSVGEVAPLRGPGRREIGHGALAEKALLAVLPDKEIFPYTIRVVSEVMSSNGSSSMASTCGSSLALMDAGVPIKEHVAGVAIGLATDGKGGYKIITDIQDLEDGPGGMDFKVAGAKSGITAMQMDTKTAGLTDKMIAEALEHGRQARLQILETMQAAIPAPREELSPYAPRIVSFKIDTDKIGEVIGPGGKVINGIIDATGVAIDIADDGLVSVTSVNKESLDKAVQMIKDIVRVPDVGEIFDGKVVRIEDYGAFIEILPGKDGMVHVSEMAWGHTRHPSDLLKIGDIVKVKVRGIDDAGRISLTMKELQPKPEGYVERPAFKPQRREEGRRPPHRRGRS